MRRRFPSPQEVRARALRDAELVAGHIATSGTDRVTVTEAVSVIRSHGNPGDKSVITSRIETAARLGLLRITAANNTASKRWVSQGSIA